MKVRRAIPEDALQIHALLCKMAQLHKEGCPEVFEGEAPKYGVDEVTELILDEGTDIFTACLGDRVAGYLICRVQITPADGLKKYRKALYIDDLCVAEDCRKEGVGSLLFDAARKRAAELECTVIDLNVWAFNKGAIRFYEKMGMKESRRHMELLV